jgi:transcriptional activator of cad operon
MSAADEPQELRFGPWCAQRDSGELTGAAGSERLEPRVMELLFLLAVAPGQVITRDDILRRLWPGLVVGEDTLARTVFKLRKALGDDARAPRYIETIPKRGYRFIADVGPPPADAGSAGGEPATEPAAADRPARGGRRAFTLRVLLVAAALATGWTAWRHAPRVESPPPADEAGTLTGRANDFYFRYSRADNEAAIELFERVIAVHPEHAPAYAGLANALAQRVVRWPASGEERTRLGDALRAGDTRSEASRRQLLRATQLAERAVALAPRDPAALKALGFVRSVREDFAGALAAYREAVAIDPDAWGPLINIGDLLDLQGRPEEALPELEAAFAAMTRAYPREPARVGPWQAELAAVIAARHLGAARAEVAEAWYRRALDIAPFHAQATRELAKLLRAQGRAEEADDLCLRLARRTGAAACA